MPAFSRSHGGRLQLPPELGHLLVEPGDAEYSRVSGTYTRRAHPAGVLFPTNGEEVALALATMRDRSRPLAVRSGGHGLSGRSTNDGGVVIDLSRLNQIEVIDPGRHLVRIGAGARWGTVAERLSDDGLAISSGDHGNVGVGGLAAGGGIGWLARSYGLTIDHVRAADVITVDGHRLRLAAEQGGEDQQELFWALRGAGAGLGVVTAFEIEAIPIESVGVAALSYLVQADGQTLTAWAAAVSRSPRELSVMAALAMYGGDLVLNVTAVVASGREDVIRAALGRLLEIGPVRAEAHVAPYKHLVSSAHEHANIGQQDMTSTTAALRSLNEGASRALVRIAQSPQRPLLQLRSLDGAVADVDSDATAFHHRSHQFLVMASVPGSESITALTDASQPMVPFADGAYPGLESRADASTFGRAYPGRTGDRVRAAWRRLDPDGRIRPIALTGSAALNPTGTTRSPSPLARAGQLREQADHDSIEGAT